MDGPPPEEMPASRGRVLVVDDDEGVRGIMTLALRRLGLEVIPAAAGREALELLEGGDCDLMFIDSGLPDLDGPDVVREWRRREQAQSGTPLPVAMMTGDPSPAAERACLDAGADTFLAKPARLDAVAGIVRRFLPVD